LMLSCIHVAVIHAQIFTAKKTKCILNKQIKEKIDFRILINFDQKLTMI